MCVCHVYVGTNRGQKRMADILELELHTVVILSRCMLEAKPWSSLKAAIALNHL